MLDSVACIPSTNNIPLSGIFNVSVVSAFTGNTNSVAPELVFLKVTVPSEDPPDTTKPRSLERLVVMSPVAVTDDVTTSEPVIRPAIVSSYYAVGESDAIPKNFNATTPPAPAVPEITTSTSSAVSVAAVVVPPDIPKTPLQGKNPLKPVELIATEIPSTKPSVSASVPMSTKFTLLAA